MSNSFKVALADEEQTAARVIPSERPELSVVMPCLNEIETVGTCVRKAIAALRFAIEAARPGSKTGKLQSIKR